ncbi:MAG: DUF732 domain-containing protein [Pseudonocardiaceae bacterium]
MIALVGAFALGLLTSCGGDPAPEPTSSLPSPTTRDPLSEQQLRQAELSKGLDLEITLNERGIPVPDRDQVISEARLVCATMATGDATRDQTADLVRVDPEHQREFVDVAIEVWCPELGS